MKQYKNVFSIVIIQIIRKSNHPTPNPDPKPRPQTPTPIPYTMNCVASTYNASGKLVGCTEQELNTIISAQLYTVFALSTGLYVYKSFTADNWADIVIQLGWGCVSAYTRTKRFAMRYVIPCICTAGSFLKDRVASVIESDSESEISTEDDHCYVRVVKDGTELHGYSSIFGLINHLAEHSVDAEEEQEQEHDSDDVVDVQSESIDQGEAKQGKQPEESNELESSASETNESESESSDAEEEDIKEQLARIENHTMQFDFVMCQVPTLQTVTSSTPQCMNVIKYDGFPRDADGSYFFDRTFAPVDHRMIEIVLQYEGSEYELDLSSPDNFYVVGNKLLDPAFLKWFMRKNHSINIVLFPNNLNNQVDPMSNYTIKCIDHNATLHTLLPCNYLHVTETGFEVHDTGLV